MIKNNNKKLARVFHFDLLRQTTGKIQFPFGKRFTLQWTELQPAAPDYFFVPKNLSFKEE
jgi:hypothetical protein